MTQPSRYSPFLIVSWNDNHLNLAKCVDFFYVEFRSANATLFQTAPAFFEQPEIDDWDDVGEDPVNRYWANVTVEFNSIYEFRVAAVDKGVQLDPDDPEPNGAAVIHSSLVTFAVPEFVSPPTAAQLAQERLRRAYPPDLCNERRLCSQLAAEWLLVLSNAALDRRIRRRDPDFLPNIDLRFSRLTEKNKRRKYERGEFHGLSRTKFVGLPIIKILSTGQLKARLDFKIRLPKVSFSWEGFFSHGILSLYHTCGQDLPTAIFNDVDEEEVEEVISSDCFYKVSVDLTTPVSLRDRYGQPRITDVKVILNRDEFKYDATWLTEHFHDLERLWTAEKSAIANKIESIFNEAYSEALKRVPPAKWTRKRLAQIAEEMRLLEHQVE